MNISGLVVRANPERFDEVLEVLEEAPWVEVYTHDGESKLVVVVEAEDTAAEMAVYRTIEGIPGVLSVELAYSYSEELEQAREELAAAEAVPEALSDDVPVEEVRYQGDVRTLLKEHLKKRKG
ncbi:MAG TPA: nitrate reductase [Oceanithermus profundus]|uniref:Chaperone NapD n=1 Tax=Oceanithermus profundus TaxID=187137 RepID=A0A7C4Z4J9_9DEIN|nr:nitrate reductase [Oceanithermus profundus]